MIVPQPTSSTTLPPASIYFTKSQFNNFMPLSVLYTTFAHLFTLFLRPTPFRLKPFPLPTTNHPSTEQRIAVCTGANTGIGYETSLTLVQNGYDVVLACRSRDAGEQAAQAINAIAKKHSSGKAIFLHPLDLSSLDSVRSFANQFHESYPTLHLLINNAGMNVKGGTSQDGLELCFHTNFVGHYLLTRLLLPKMKDNGRIVNVSSVMHHFCSDAKLDQESWWKDCITKPRFSENVYAESKLAAILFSLELNKRFSGKEGIRAVSVNPGAVNSDIWRSFPKFLLKYIIRPLFRLLYLTPKQGSQTSIAAAIGNLPPDAIYLQPYVQPPFSRKKNNKSNVERQYGIPFPVFEMLGPFIGHAVTDPRLPENKETCSEVLWNVCEKIVGLTCAGTNK